MTSCNKTWVPLIERFGVLTPSERIELGHHLESCPDCQRLFARETALSQLLRSLPPLEVPPGLKQTTLHLVKEAMTSDTNRPKWYIFWPGLNIHRLPFQLFSATALILFFVSVIVLMPRSTHQIQDLSSYYLARSYSDQTYLYIDDHHLSLGGMHERERAEVAEVIMSLLSNEGEIGHFSSRLYQSFDFSTEQNSERPSTCITMSDSHTE